LGQSSTTWTTDFLLIAHSRSKGQDEGLQRLLAVFDRLKVPVAPEKLEGSAMKLKFLGIELDTVRLSLHLPAEQLAELRLHAAGLGKKFATVKEIESLVGKLQSCSMQLSYQRLSYLSFLSIQVPFLPAFHGQAGQDFHKTPV